MKQWRRVFSDKSIKFQHCSRFMAEGTSMAACLPFSIAHLATGKWWFQSVAM
ncbi:hypothetical protein EVA_07604 [gut metagenome]|uniref:Uncharacterized protein n=1 Tax=gut metagenome TaxID=749906 RepID=J9GPF8_9ZZZZ